MFFPRVCAVLLGIGGYWLCTPVTAQETAEIRIGHSAHGAAFDVGPRRQPWKMDGIGSCHFPITSTHPEVQEWFDQGIALLHSFWYFEAERAFRWCLKLDSECAMAYWGLARAAASWGGANSDRVQEVLKEASLRKDQVTERERRYIEAWELAYTPEWAGELEEDERSDSERVLTRELEKIVLDFPEDIEAKALLVLYTMYSSTRYGNERIIQEILAAEPHHPGAHHYRVHVWDGPEGKQALNSCAVYGELAGSVGHANHMPGHVYSGIGMWHEAAIWMDSATRVEKRYMRDRLVFPFQNGNYAHNRNYLSYIQEQLGMVERALDGARQLVEAPLDPDYNTADKNYLTYTQGIRSMVRSLLKFEQWDRVLREGEIPWGDGSDNRIRQLYAEALAHAHLGNRAPALERFLQLKELSTEIQPQDRRFRRIYDFYVKDVQASLLLHEGKRLEALALFYELAQEQHRDFWRHNDPPDERCVYFDLVGELLLQDGSHAMAIDAFEKSLEIVYNNAFAFAGLARSYAALKQTETARGYAGRFRFVWSDADPGLRWSKQVAELDLEPQPTDDSPASQRNYLATSLEHLGPEQWQPFAAPELRCLSPDEESIDLKQFAGRNVLLVFFLGSECPHCVDQLKLIDENIAEFQSRDTVVLAVSRDTPQENRDSLELGDLPFVLLSDKDFENARRFNSYDDFEEMELHSTTLIDRQGRIRWARFGGDPFTDMDFLLEEIDRFDRSAGLADGGPNRGSK